MIHMKTALGMITYDPIAYAIGRRKITRIRPFLPLLFKTVFEQRKLLCEKDQKTLSFYQRKIKDDPDLLTRTGPNSVSSIIVNNIYEIFCKLPPDALHKYIQNALIVTTIKENWGIVKLPIAVITEARELIGKQYGHKPAISNWGPHITFLRGESYSEKLLDNTPIEIYYNDKIRMGKNNYFYYDVISNDLENLRISLGLRKHPNPDFHITIGKLA